MEVDGDCNAGAIDLVARTECHLIEGSMDQEGAAATKVCFMCYFMAIHYYARKNITPTEFEHLRPLCSCMHSHIGEATGFVRELESENGGIDGTVIHDHLTTELSKLQILIAMSERGENISQYDCVDGVSISSQPHLGSIHKVCDGLKPVAKLIYKSFIAFVYSLIKQKCS